MFLLAHKMVVFIILQGLHENSGASVQQILLYDRKASTTTFETKNTKGYPEKVVACIAYIWCRAIRVQSMSRVHG